MTGENKGKLIIISNVTEQCKTDCKPGRTRSSYDVDFDKTSIQQLFKYMKFEYKAKTGFMQCQTREVCLLYFVQRKKNHHSYIILLILV
jgi:hypothetical protein